MPTMELYTVRRRAIDLGELFWEAKAERHVEVLVGLLDQPDGAEEDQDDVEAEDHGEELRFQSAKTEARDDDIGKGAQARGGQGGAERDELAVGLRSLGGAGLKKAKPRKSHCHPFSGPPLMWVKQ